MAPTAAGAADAYRVVTNVSPSRASGDGGTGEAATSPVRAARTLGRISSSGTRGFSSIIVATPGAGEVASRTTSRCVERLVITVSRRRRANISAAKTAAALPPSSRASSVRLFAEGSRSSPAGAEVSAPAVTTGGAMAPSSKTRSPSVACRVSTLVSVGSGEALPGGDTAATGAAVVVRTGVWLRAAGGFVTGAVLLVSATGAGVAVILGIAVCVVGWTDDAAGIVVSTSGITIVGAVDGCAVGATGELITGVPVCISCAAAAIGAVVVPSASIAAIAMGAQRALRWGFVIAVKKRTIFSVGSVYRPFR